MQFQLFGKVFFVFEQNNKREINNKLRRKEDNYTLISLVRQYKIVTIVKILQY